VNQRYVTVTHMQLQHAHLLSNCCQSSHSPSYLMMKLPAGMVRVAYAPLPRTSPVGLTCTEPGAMAGPCHGTPSCT
jgi:hypothetical protein